MVIYCRNSNTILHQHGSTLLLNFLELSQSASLCSEASIFALIGLNKHSFVQKIKFTSIEYSAVLAVQAAQKHGSLHIKTMSEVNSITKDCLKT